MNKLLYVLQYDDDPYTAPYSGEIFTNKKTLLKYVKNNDLTDFRYLSIYVYDNDIKGYQESTHLYYLNKSDYLECVRHFWKDFKDKTFIPSIKYHNILQEIEKAYPIQ